jgi:hypothetical protein
MSRNGGGTAVRGTGPSTDPFDNLPGLAALRTAAQTRDWAATQTFFSRLGSVDDLSTACGLLADLDGVEDYLERAAADRPGDPLPRTLLAERYIRVGWAIRSDLGAEHVSRDRFEQFHDWLRKAERLLIEVCAEQPAYVPAWAARLITARGLELGQSEARRRYDRLAAAHPHHYRAQSLLLQQLCPKWGGTWEEAHGFARACATAAPNGSHSATLVATAHIERWLDLDAGEDDAYMRGLPVRDDLRHAAEVSVLHRDHRPVWGWIGAHSTFALAFSLGGHFEDAAPHFAALGDRASESPWSYLPDWKSRFAKYRRTALATL